MIKMKGVVAVPGQYKYGDVIEVKTAEELKDAAQRNPIIPLTFGHTVDGLPPTASMQIGTLSQKWSEEQQKVLGDFWFYEEKIPASLRKKIDNGERLPISAGLLLDSVDEDGTQRGISYTHMAILEGEDPKCPLGTCGVNVRVESERIVRLEQTAELTTPPPPPEAEKKETEATPEAAEPVTTEEAAPEPPKPEVPVEQKPKEADVVPVVEEEVPLEPEIIIPPSVPVVQKAFEVIDGKYVFVPDIFKQKQEKK